MSEVRYSSLWDIDRRAT